MLPPGLSSSPSEPAQRAESAEIQLPLSPTHEPTRLQRQLQQHLQQAERLSWESSRTSTSGTGASDAAPSLELQFGDTDHGPPVHEAHDELQACDLTWCRHPPVTITYEPRSPACSPRVSSASGIPQPGRSHVEKHKSSKPSLFRKVCCLLRKMSQVSSSSCWSCSSGPSPAPSPAHPATPCHPQVECHRPRHRLATLPSTQTSTRVARAAGPRPPHPAGCQATTPTSAWVPYEDQSSLLVSTPPCSLPPGMARGTWHLADYPTRHWFHRGRHCCLFWARCSLSGVQVVLKVYDLRELDFKYGRRVLREARLQCEQGEAAAAAVTQLYAAFREGPLVVLVLECAGAPFVDACAHSCPCVHALGCPGPSAHPAFVADGWPGGPCVAYWLAGAQGLACFLGGAHRPWVLGFEGLRV